MRDVETQWSMITNFITPNAHGINMYLKYPELNRFCRDSRYILPDGQPIVWLSKFTPRSIRERLTGSDFFPVIFGKLKNEKYKCLLVVSTPVVAKGLAADKPDGFFIVPEFFEMNETAKIEAIAREMAKLISREKIQYVFIGVSEPKQGALAQATTNLLKGQQFPGNVVFFFLGASYEFYLGMKKRAPAAFRKTGMEWFFRLITEPKRMYKRYIWGNLLFVMRATGWIVNRKLYSAQKQ